MDDNSGGLSTFRRQWQQELASHGGRRESRDEVEELGDQLGAVKLEPAADQEARELFEQAVALELAGRVFDALPLYKRAVHLVPDIEYRMHELSKRKSSATKRSGSEPKDTYVSDDQIDDSIDLYQLFLESVQQTGRWCENALATDQATRAHISHLPYEVFLLISKWVISNDLDVQSLERLALVCKGFYVCARDPETWRLICLKVWGLQLGSLEESPFPSWRQMYFERHRLHFDGCYISKTDYFRHGENSFQDQFYKPLHHIAYYRYLRFFPDGVVLMLTTADDPQITVKKLSSRVPKKKETMRGFFRLTNDVVTIMLHRKLNLDVPLIVPEKRSRTNPPPPPPMSYEQTFHIELKVQSSPRRRFNQLQWNQYRILQRKNQIESSSEFELTKAQYPVFYFSRVEHYSRETTSILTLKG